MNKVKNADSNSVKDYLNLPKGSLSQNRGLLFFFSHSLFVWEKQESLIVWWNGKSLRRDLYLNFHLSFLGFSPSLGYGSQYASSNLENFQHLIC